MQKKICIIGCGASGMMAAICAAREGVEVSIFEHAKPGKKILSTGNGKCNLTNRIMNSDCFFTHNRIRLESCLNRFGTEDTVSFFESLGLLIKEKNGYLYPMSEQASMVLQILLEEIKRLGIRIIHDETILQIKTVDKQLPGRRVYIVTNNKHIYFDSVIISCGSKAAPKTGSDGSGYDYAKQLGHKLQPVLPSLVQLRCKDKYCKELAGIRTEAKIQVFDRNTYLCEEQGELQLTDYGISGIPVFQLSGCVNRYLYHNKHSELIAKIDFLPHYDEKTWNEIIHKRILTFQDTSVERFFIGLLNQKLMNLFMKLSKIKPEIKVKDVERHQLLSVFDMCRNFSFHIEGSNGFEQAQVCTGGIDLSEVTDNLESIFAPNVYFTGEILDVDGRCGGYNLQWAWTTGYIAGTAASHIGEKEC